MTMRRKKTIVLQGKFATREDVEAQIAREEAGQLGDRIAAESYAPSPYRGQTITKLKVIDAGNGLKRVAFEKTCAGRTRVLGTHFVIKDGGEVVISRDRTLDSRIVHGSTSKLKVQKSGDGAKKSTRLLSD